jgi:multisubunit Na+/H+ antiporter MnhB subunit
MTPALVFDLLLCALILAVAAGAVAARDLFAAVVFFIVYGLLVAIAWVRLGAADVALTEAAIGAGLTGLLFVGAASRLGGLGKTVEAVERSSRTATALRFALFAAGALALGAILSTLPERAAGLRPLVERDLAASGVANPITAVLLNFRGYDTLLESIVLLVSLVGIWSLTPNHCWGGGAGPKHHAKPEGVLAYFGRILPAVAFLVGAYLLQTGADAPGGAFQAGTVLAAAWLLAIMAGLIEAPAVSSRRLRLLLAVGPAFFLLIGALTAFGGAFLRYPPGAAKALIVAIEALLAVSIAATLTLVILGPPRRPS